MADISEHCQELLDEYKVLRRQVEEDEFTNPDLDEAGTNADNQSDLDRLEEIKELLEEECDVDIPEEGETDLDLPEYAAESPSEPMDFDAE